MKSCGERATRACASRPPTDTTLTSPSSTTTWTKPSAPSRPPWRQSPRTPSGYRSPGCSRRPAGGSSTPVRVRHPRGGSSEILQGGTAKTLYDDFICILIFDQFEPSSISILPEIANLQICNTLSVCRLFRRIRLGVPRQISSLQSIEGLSC